MNFHSLTQCIKKYAFFYLTGFLVILGIKYFYRQADADELRWILAPTAGWVSILTGIPFLYRPDMGYVNYDFRFVIAPSCSGVQFMMITMAMLIFSFVHRVDGHNKDSQDNLCESALLGKNEKKKCLCWTIGSIGISYLLTIFINGLRIMVAIYLPQLLSRTALYRNFLTADSLHTIIGTTVYFASLLVIYRLADALCLRINKFPGEIRQSSTRSFLHRCISPVFWYFFIVLGIPFLNRAYQRYPDQFTNYATLIVLVCTSILLLSLGSVRMHRRFQQLMGRFVNAHSDYHSHKRSQGKP